MKLLEVFAPLTKSIVASVNPEIEAAQERAFSGKPREVSYFGDVAWVDVINNEGTVDVYFVFHDEDGSVQIIPCFTLEP